MSKKGGAPPCFHSSPHLKSMRFMLTKKHIYCFSAEYVDDMLQSASVHNLGFLILSCFDLLICKEKGQFESTTLLPLVQHPDLYSPEP